MNNPFSEKKCVPCTAATPKLELGRAKELLANVPGWELKGDTIERSYRFMNFREAMAFVNRVAEIAEQEGHHPDIHVSYNRVRFELSTHKIHGLSENDFILAAKINQAGSYAASSAA